jgi:tellurite methyltransferase
MAEDATYARRFMSASVVPLPIVEQLPFRCLKNALAIDLGTGNGRHAVYLAQRGLHVDAIDAFSPAIDEIVRYARRQTLPINAYVHDLRERDCDFRRYGLVLITLILHHLSPSHAISLLQNARMQATPGTVHVLAAITREGDFCRDVLPDTRYYPYASELHDAYHDADWEILKSYQEIRKMSQQRADGSPTENLVSFLIARKPSLEREE